MSSRPLILCLLLLGFASANGADRTARIIERYKQILAANPVAGPALDQFWKTAQESNTAGQLLEEYKTAGANDFAGALIYGHLLGKAGRTEEAREAFNHAAALDGKSALPHLALADSFAGEPKQAAEELEKAAALSPSPDVWLKLGTAWLAANEPEKAAAAWERTVALNPDDLNLRQQLADTYVSNALLDKAISHFEYIEKHGEVAQRANALRSLARIHQARGETDAAMQDLEKGIALTAPGNWLRSELQRQLIRLCQRSHRTNELEASWKEAAARNPRDLGVYLQLIELYENLADLPQQRVWLEKLHALAPKNQDYKMKLARVLVQLNETDAAARIFDEIATDQPTNAEAVFGRAEIDLRNDRPDEAKRRIEALLELKQHEESLVAKAVDFYSRHRMPEMVEQHLKEGAGRNEEGILALAGFYFSERRPTEAQAILQRLLKKNDPPEAQAAAHLKIASALREQNVPEAAADELRLAVKLQPKSADYCVALAESLMALNRFDEAQAAFEQAVALSGEGEARIAIDRKLFQLLQMRSAQKAPAERGLPLDSEGRIDLLSIPVPTLTPAAMRENAPLQKYIAAMSKRAATKPEDALRVARWLNWSRRNKEALVFAKKALAMDPNSVPAGELVAQIASSDGQTDVAMKALSELIRVNPAGERVYRKRMGQLQQEAGDVEGALATFVELEKSKPGDPEALADLALAQQQADQWSDALATWQRAYELAPASKRRDLLRPLQRAMEHLQLSAKAAELFLKAVDEQTDATAQSALFQDLLAHCVTHQSLPWLEEQFRQRHKSHPDDYFTEVALARILKARGQHAEALALLSDAAFAAPEEADALRELTREAEEAGDFAGAIRHQARLVAIAPQDDPVNPEKLAVLQEDWLDLDAATRTWEQIAAQFPRDPAALERAADFFQAWDAAKRAHELLRKVRELDPANTGALIKLAQLAQEAGDRDEALACYQQVLAKSDGEREGDTIVYPDVKAAHPGKLQQTYLSALRWRDGRASAKTMHALSSFWVDESAAGASSNVRLTAIREISRLLEPGSGAQKEWLARWQAKRETAPGEALWAFYYSGASGLTLDHVAELAARAPDKTQASQAFVWLALQMGEYGRLSRWMQDAKRLPEERDLLLIALSQLLEGEDAAVDPKLIGGLFPPDFKQRYLLWQSAAIFARHNCFAGAVQLGQRVFNEVSADRAAYGVELARWEICAGDIDGARRVLRKSITDTGDAFDSPIYEALREYYGLLPESERTEFIEAYAKSVQDRPLHAAIAMTLLRGLQGAEQPAQEAITHLLDLRAITPRTEDEGAGPHRSWNFILAAGVQLQQWNLDDLAVYLWEQAVADEAMIRLQGPQAAAIAREIRMRLLAARLQEAGPVEGAAMIEEFARTTSGDLLLALGGLLESSGATRESVEVYQYLWKRQPKNPQFLRALLNACRVADDRDTAKSVIVEWLAAESPGAVPAVYADFVIQLADLLAADNDSQGALGVLEAGVKSMPDQRPLQQRLAQEYMRSSQWDRAAEIYRRFLGEGGTAGVESIVNLANALSSGGRTAEAIEAIASSGVSNEPLDGMLARLLVKAGRPDDAVRVGVRLARSGRQDELCSLATELAHKGGNKQAAALLQSAMQKSRDPQAAFQLQMKTVELFSPRKEPVLFSRLMHRLEDLADSAAQDETVLYDFQRRIAHEFKLEDAYRRQWVDAWHNGAGTVADGMNLAEFHAEKKQGAELREVGASLLARKDMDTRSLVRLNSLLADAGLYELAVKASDILCARNPVDVDRALDRIRSLQRSGQKTAALSALESLRAREVLDDTITGRVAGLYVEMGNATEARKAFAAATKADPLARNYRLYLAYARFLASEKQFSAAKHIIRIAFGNPANGEIDQIAKVYAAAGKLDRLEAEAGEFQLAPRLRPGLFAAMFAEYATAGRLAEALAVAQNHPEIVPTETDVAGRLRWIAGKTGNDPEVAAILEKAIAQWVATSHTAWLDEAALFYADWADKELAGFQTEAAIGHLKRAHEIRPGRFDVAQKLCKLYVEQKQPDRAEQVLENFLGASDDETEKETARQMLTAMRREGG